MGRLTDALREEWIYFTGRALNPTTHNLAIRDLYSKIVGSNYEIAEVNFFPNLKTLTPDLLVSFLAADGTFIKTFWEYDAGTEGIAELVRKVERYAGYKEEYEITFAFNTREKMEQVNKIVKESCIRLAVLDEFSHLDDEAFRFASEASVSGFFI